MKDVVIFGLLIAGVLVVGLKFEGENNALKTKLLEQQKQIERLEIEKNSFREGVLSTK